VAPVPSEANSNVSMAKDLVCPPSLLASREKLYTSRIRFFPLPCGMKYGSNITIIGKPQPTQWRYNSLNEQGEVSQFLVEVQGFESRTNDMHPSIVFHLNPRLCGDWSGKLVIEHNSRYAKTNGVSLIDVMGKNMKDEVSANSILINRDFFKL